MQIWLWVAFIAFVLVMMFLDLKVVGRRDRSVPVKTALLWTGLCVLLALGFTPILHWLYDTHALGMGTHVSATTGQDVTVTGRAAVTLFLQGWLLEYSLSVDNLFVFAVIFTHFRVPAQYQHRALAWGILAALLLRGVMIASGAWLFGHFHWLLYVAGAFLIYTAWGMIKGKEDDYDPEQSLAARLVRKVFPLEPRLHEDRFFVRRGDGVLAMTPLFLVLVVMNVADIVFALDSIPAIFGVTTDPFLVFTSNVFAIMGLRSLYFAIAALMGKFDRIKYSLAFILAFIGVKMLLEAGEDVSRWWNMLVKPAAPAAIPHVHLPSWVSLAVIVAALATGIAASMMARPATGEQA